MAYWVITRFEPRACHYILTSLGLLAALYGFYQAFKTIRRWKIEVGNAAVALVLTSAGLVSTIYGFAQAYRGTLAGASGRWEIFWVALVTIGLAGALYGFWRGYKEIVRQMRGQGSD